MQALLGNFALILFVLMLVTGVIWFADTFFLSKQRRARADAALAEFDARVARDEAQGIKRDGSVASSRADLQAHHLKQPAWIEYSGSFFPVIALVFCLRSFLYEPFKIPSSSMVPTLLVGDLILVNKFTYGIRLPIINKKIIEVSQPQRGDVMVFKFPKDPSVDYIKRVVGVPGDKIVYKNKRLTINGEQISYKALPDYLDQENLTYYKQWQENLTGVEHKILTDERAPNFVPNPDAFPHHELCTYNADGFACTVPPGEYFMMGDNRDNSLDSRYWGFVPDQNIVGKAFFVWMNLGDITRIGSFH
ncbi:MULTISPECIES: signal peptidase I [Herbaspirillum]|jgi:signal peptidase I|uniref:Signal peptidase I n=1 Tax=Herbaspirillum rubrisubalbicans Os34 TaxID=1235827 RepID=A0A6M3ZQI6_9BURK|nr:MULTISPECIES: signal peptidase I [Herbaspirillum]MCP1571983.1 signal peptidase I [Herbaspirillum rubrisubalbicans]NQE48464.1 signal peptidase [Herbaspirillum rubrisubalbicans]QJQ00641.1 signal peptidase I [Herbaspirillum rubrisubalbicans Os34]